MTPPDYVDPSEAQVRVLTEDEYVAWRRGTGSKIISSRGAYWCESYPGFYQNVHYLSRMSAEQARRPAAFCWGFRTALDDCDRAFANASSPLCILPGLREYDESSLRRSARQDLLRCRKRVRIVQLTEPSLLRQQGYQVYLSSLERVGSRAILGREAYLAKAERLFQNGYRLILAGLVGDRLAGYCESFAIEDCAYLWVVYVATEFLRTNVSIGLDFEQMQLYRRTGVIDSVVNGPDWPERPSLTAFKERLNFQVVHIPARLSMPYPARAALRRLRPWAYYRLTGRDHDR